MKPEVIPKNIPLIYYYNIKVKDKKKKTDLKKNEILKSILKKARRNQGKCAIYVQIAQEEQQIANTYMKRYSTSQIVKEINIKAICTN